MSFLTWLWGKVSGVSLAVWGYVALAGGALLLLLKIFNAGKTAQQVDDLKKDSVIKDDQLKSAVDRPNTDSALDDKLHSGNF